MQQLVVTVGALAAAVDAGCGDNPLREALRASMAVGADGSIELTACAFAVRARR